LIGTQRVWNALGTGLHTEALIVGNDGLVEQLRLDFPRFELVANATNVGLRTRDSQALDMVRGATSFY